MKRSYYICMVFVCAAWWGTSAWGGQFWEIRNVDSRPGSGGAMGLALDAQDHPHLVHRSAGLSYATHTGTNWVRREVSAIGDYGSIVVDGAGTPHIAFSYNDWAAGTDEGRYAYWDGAAWQTETMSTGSVFRTSIALDQNEDPHISFYDPSWPTYGIYYAHKPASTWLVEAVDPYAQSHQDLVVDSANTPSIAYAGGVHPDYTVYYVSRTGPGTWSTNSVYLSRANDVSVVLDSTNGAHLSFYESPHGVFYSAPTGSTWATTNAYTSGSKPAVAVDGNDRPHLSYIDTGSSTSELRHAWWTGSAWTSETVVADADLGGHTAIAVTSDDLPRIAFKNNNTGFWLASLVSDFDNDGMPDYWEELHGFLTNDMADATGDPDMDLLDNLGEYRAETHPRDPDSDNDTFNDKQEIDAGTDPNDDQHFPGTGWSVEVVDDGHYDVALALTAAGQPRIAYLGPSQDLRYAASGSWTIENVETNVTTGGPFALGLQMDTNDNPHIVYGPEGMLTYTTRDGTWSNEVFVNQDGWGYQADFALDDAGTPHVVHMDSWSWPPIIYYETKDSGVWTNDEVGQIENGAYPSVAVSANGHPRLTVTFDEGMGGGVDYILWGNGFWPRTPVDTNVYGETSLASAPDGTPRVAMVDFYSSDALHYAVWNTTNSSFDTASAGLDNLTDIDLAVGLDGAPHIAAYHTVQMDLRYVTWTPGSGWTSTVVDSLGNVGRPCAIAVDAGGGVHISYYDATNEKVKYAVKGGASGPADTDNDGIPDDHETGGGVYNGPTDTGTNPNNPDSDGDGHTDGEEVYVTGTDPNQATSLFHIMDPAPNGTGVVIQWSSVTGRTYTVSHCPDLVESNFTGISGPLAADPPMNTYTDTVQRTPPSFYNVDVFKNP